MDDRVAEIQAGMYQYSRAIYRSIKDLTDPYVDETTQLEYRRAVLESCEQTMERLATDPHYFANPDRTLFRTFGATSPSRTKHRWPGALTTAGAPRATSSRSRSTPEPSTAASPAAARRRARGSRASAHPSRSASTARRTSTSSSARGSLPEPLSSLA